MPQKKNILQVLADLLLVTVGAALMAFAVGMLLNPSQIVPGGVTGLAMSIHNLFPALSVGTLIMVINIPLFALSLKFGGRMFLAYTVYGTVVSSLFIDLFAMLDPPALDQLSAALFGGVCMGAGLGIVFSRGATTGGSDIAARLLNRVFPHVQIGRIVLAIDGVVIVIAGLVFQSLTSALYASVTVFLSSMVMDWILYGSNVARTVFVVSEKAEELVRVIAEELSRGVTLLSGAGGYTGKPRQVLFCAVRRQEVVRLKRRVAEIDPHAFVVLGEAKEVLGEGFAAVGQ